MLICICFYSPILLHFCFFHLLLRSACFLCSVLFLYCIIFLVKHNAFNHREHCSFLKIMGVWHMSQNRKINCCARTWFMKPLSWPLWLDLFVLLFSCHSYQFNLREKLHNDLSGQCVDETLPPFSCIWTCCMSCCSPLLIILLIQKSNSLPVIPTDVHLRGVILHVALELDACCCALNNQFCSAGSWRRWLCTFVISIRFYQQLLNHMAFESHIIHAIHLFLISQIFLVFKSFLFFFTFVQLIEWNCTNEARGTFMVADYATLSEPLHPWEVLFNFSFLKLLHT